MTAERERNRDKSYILDDLWQDISLVVKYVVGGFLLGLLISLDSALLMGFSFGKGRFHRCSVREKVKDLMR